MSESPRRPIILLAISALSGSLGMQIVLFAIPLLAIGELGASPIEMGVLSLLDSAAALSFGLLVGAAVDRVSGVVAVCIAEILRCAVILTLALSTLFGLSIWALYFALFCVGIASFMHEAGVSTAVVELGGRTTRVLNRVNATLRGSSVISELTGPGLAGLLVVALGFTVSLIGGVAGFGLAALCAFAVVRTRVGREETSAPSRHRLDAVPASQSTREVDSPETERSLNRGLRFIWSHAVLKPLVRSTMQFNFFTAAFQSVFLYFCVHELQFGPLDLAVTGIAAGVGGLTGSALAAASVVNRHQKNWYLAALALPSLCVLAILLSAGQPWSVRLLLVASGEFAWCFAMVICVVLFNTVRQVSSPDHMVGQIAASERMIAVAGEVPGALLGGLVGTVWSPQATMVPAMVGIALSGLWAIRVSDWSPRP